MTGLVAGGAFPVAPPTSALASRSASLYNSPTKTTRPFAADYPVKASADGTGKLLYDIEGRPLVAERIVGRRTLGGADEALSPAQLDAAATGILGRTPEAVPASALPRNAVGAYRVFRGQDGPERRIDILRNLEPASASKVTAHEFGHAIDDLAGDLSSKGLSNELSRIYNDLNRQDWRFAAQERTGVPVQPKYRTRPEDFGYRSVDVPREYIAEAVRAYMADGLDLAGEADC